MAIANAAYHATREQVCNLPITIDEVLSGVYRIGRRKLLQLITRYAQADPSRPIKMDRLAVQRVREYLQAHYTENVSLQQLAQVAALSAFHLTRIFTQAIGIPPHTYQIHLRIGRAKRLLMCGHSPATVAISTGFYDQSHFGAHFKRLVGVRSASAPDKLL